MHAPGDANRPLTDPDDALRRAGNRPEVAAELFTLLRNTLDETAGHMHEAARSGDVEALRETAHRLHGACLYCGVPRLRAAVAEIERLCEAGDRGVPSAELEQPVARLLDTIKATRAAPDPLAGRAAD